MCLHIELVVVWLQSNNLWSCGLLCCLRATEFASRVPITAREWRSNWLVVACEGIVYCSLHSKCSCEAASYTVSMETREVMAWAAYGVDCVFVHPIALTACGSEYKRVRYKDFDKDSEILETT